MTFFQAFLDELFLYGEQGVWGSSTPKNVLILEIQVFWRKIQKKVTIFQYWRYSISRIPYWILSVSTLWKGSRSLVLIDTRYDSIRLGCSCAILWHITISSKVHAISNIFTAEFPLSCEEPWQTSGKKLKDDKCMLSVDGMARFVICGHGECCRQCNLILFEK